MSSSFLQYVSLFFTLVFGLSSIYFIFRQIYIVYNLGFTPYSVRRDYRNHKKLWYICIITIFFSGIVASYFNVRSKEKATQDWNDFNGINTSIYNRIPGVDLPNIKTQSDKTTASRNDVCSHLTWNGNTVYVSGEITISGMRLANSTLIPRAIVINGKDVFETLYLMCRY